MLKARCLASIRAPLLIPLGSARALHWRRPEPYFVLGKNMATNQVIVARARNLVARLRGHELESGYAAPFGW